MNNKLAIKPVQQTKTSKAPVIILGILGLMIFLGKKSDKKTQKDKQKGLQGSVCKKRFKCNGVKAKTGRLKKGNKFVKGGGVKKVKGLDQNNRLKKGFKWENKKVVKANARKKNSKKPLKVNL